MKKKKSRRYRQGTANKESFIDSIHSNTQHSRRKTVTHSLTFFSSTGRMPSSCIRVDLNTWPIKYDKSGLPGLSRFCPEICFMA